MLFELLIYRAVFLKNKKYISTPLITKSYILSLSKIITVDKTENNTMQMLIILGKIPFSFVIQVRYARIGEKSANKVQPTIIKLL